MIGILVHISLLNLFSVIFCYRYLVGNLFIVSLHTDCLSAGTAWVV